MTRKRLLGSYLKGVVNPSLLYSFGYSPLSKYLSIYVDLISLYIARVSTLFSKNSLIIINYKIYPTKDLLKYPSVEPKDLGTPAHFE